jgi:undecaprenyl-diphosphatase
MDQNLLLMVNQAWAQPWLDPFFAWISQDLLFSTPLLLLVAGFLAWRFGVDGFKFWGLTILLVGLGDQFGALLKELTAQPRPCAELGEAVRQVVTVFDINCSRRANGMPSNHALNFFLFATFTGWVLAWRLWLVGFVLLAALVALSRVYLGVHYPSQILAGSLIGSALGCGVGWMCVKHLPLAQRVRQRAGRPRSA